ncbi:hypothetical protein K440DRAFT_613356 [Wilcoxina mikolae CBS 423.85]|nr:hypothetical protein K440DRAFT_613356 [Wilcoxina mikolae CBS 423.85]
MQFSTITVLLAFAASAFSLAIPEHEKRYARGVCPAEDANTPTAYLPDNADCTIYYACSSSGPIQFQCPQGLWFNPDRFTCDFPEKAGCKLIARA